MPLMLLQSRNIGFLSHLPFLQGDKGEEGPKGEKVVSINPIPQKHMYMEMSLFSQHLLYVFKGRRWSSWKIYCDEGEYSM